MAKQSYENSYQDFVQHKQMYQMYLKEKMTMEKEFMNEDFKRLTANHNGYAPQEENSYNNAYNQEYYAEEQNYYNNGMYNQEINNQDPYNRNCYYNGQQNNNDQAYNNQYYNGEFYQEQPTHNYQEMPVNDFQGYDNYYNNDYYQYDSYNQQKMNQNVYGHQDSEAKHTNSKYNDANKTASTYYENENSVQHQDMPYKTLKCLKKTSKNSMTENEQTNCVSGQTNSSDEAKQSEKEDSEIKDFILQGCGSPIIRFTDEPYIKNSNKVVKTDNKEDERIPTFGDTVLLNVVDEREQNVLQSSVTCGNI